MAIKEQTMKLRRNYPFLLFTRVGKGPQKEFYQKKIAELFLNHIQICTPWLEAEDYPTLLGERHVRSLFTLL